MAISRLIFAAFFWDKDGNRMSEKMSSSDKASLWMVAFVCLTATMIVGLVLSYYHFKPEQVQIEEIRNERATNLISVLMLSDSKDKEAILQALKYMHLSENEVKEIQAEVTEEHDFETEPGTTEGR